MSEVTEWFKSLPIFTRWWLISTLTFTLFGRFNILGQKSLILEYTGLINNFEIWRAFTSIVYYPLTPLTGFHFLINCYFLYNYSMRLERGDYDGRPADYLYMLLFNGLCCNIIGLWGNLPLLMDPMILSVLYIWCQLNRDAIVSFWFGIKFKATYLPWALFGFNFIISGGGLLELVGIIVGHLYFFLKFKYPQEFGGMDILETPKFLESYFPPSHGRIRGFGTAPVHQPQGPPRTNRNLFGGHNWGRGHVLDQ